MTAQTKSPRAEDELRRTGFHALPRRTSLSARVRNRMRVSCC